MKRLFYLMLLLAGTIGQAFATGEPSTYFNIFVPPNNDPVQRNVALIVTAIYDSTMIDIIDDDMDGDNDDSYSGMLMAGQSYVLYIKDNGINDDAKYASGGVLKQDGDYFIITSNKLVYASQSTDSDWQFDYVPSVNKSSVGERFIVYAPKRSSSNRDLNVFAYEDNTSITIKLISTSVHMQTGENTVDIFQDSVIVQRTLNIGEDIIHHFQDGRNVMESGHTYLIESNKGVSIQYGALYQNSRDGGGYVPSSNGSSSGELFYFTVPYQASREQEIRIISWDTLNTVELHRYHNGNWVYVDDWNINTMETGDWVGAQANATYANVFRVKCSNAKKVSVFTANWLETGNPGTSDIATMTSAKNGTASGKEFLCYMAPPGQEKNVVDPFSNEKFAGEYSHLYLFAKDSANVTICDAYSNGAEYTKTFAIGPGRYADCALSLQEWKRIYNGTGKPNGPERPYLHVSSDANISVMNTNFNDNWMMYFGSSLQQSFGQESSSSQVEGAPGDSITVTSEIELNTNDSITDVSALVTIGSGAIPTSCTFIDSTNLDSISGVITIGTESSVITFDSLPNLDTNGHYSVITEIVLLAGENNGDPMGNATVVTVETSISGIVDGTPQQSITTEGISNNVNNANNLIYTPMATGDLVNTATDSWNAAWVDIDNDNDQDLFVCTRDLNQGNMLYRNNGNGSFTVLSNQALIDNQRQTMSSVWSDIDNDGDIDVLLVNNNYHPLELYLNDGSGNFSYQSGAGFDIHPGYYHGGSFADFDNDGYVDLLVTNYMPTRFHELYHNNGNGTFSLIANSAVSATSNHTVSPSFVDVNNDGLMDLFIPNSQGANNSLFLNSAGDFETVASGDLVSDGGFSVASCWADLNNDGFMDVFVANSSDEKDLFYWNNGDGTFNKDTTLAFVANNSNTHGCSWIDVDNDMDLDLYLTDDQGAKQLYIQQSPLLFVNKIDEIAVTNYGNSYGQAVADYDQDGFQDIFVSTHSGQNNQLFHNNGNSNNYLNISLTGTQSNQSAIGARVACLSGGVWQYQFVTTQSGFGSQNSLNLHFGLGQNNQADSILVHWPSGYMQIVGSKNANQFITVIEDSASLVSGVLYHDENNNCMLDTNESGIAHQQIRIQPSGQLVNTDAQGHYEMYLAQGSYDLSYQGNNYWDQNCGDLTISVGANASPIPNQYLALVALQNGVDLSVDYTTTAWRRGFENNSILTIGNFGTQIAYNQEVTLTFPMEIQLNQSSLNWEINNGSTYTWTIDSLRPGSVQTIVLTDSVGLDAFVGQTLQVNATIQTPGNELNTANNQSAYVGEVVGAIDPNDLIGWPKPVDGIGWVSTFDTLTYMIRFQNVGTWLASNVVVTNGLPKGTDPNSLEIIASSHNATLEINQDRKLRWTFRNINLPDSGSNESESHGYIKYRVKVDSKTVDGFKIKNQAHIKFDFEDPIATNIVVHQIKTSGDRIIGALDIFPNPATSGNITVSIRASVDGIKPVIDQLRLKDLFGQPILIQNGNQSNVQVLLPSLPSGIYLIIATDVKGQQYLGKIVIN